jgi:hypothetical protein
MCDSVQHSCSSVLPVCTFRPKESLIFEEHSTADGFYGCMLSPGYPRLLSGPALFTVDSFGVESRIQYPASNIQHPASSIEHLASSIQHLVSQILPTFESSYFPWFTCMKRPILVFLILFIPSLIFGSQKVLVLHGYACPKVLMNKLEKRVKRSHFDTENYGYKSMSEDLDSLGKDLALHVRSLKVDTVSFVTHSMGALVVRSMLNYSKTEPNFPVVYRIVMISPPNNGAEMADIGSSMGIPKFMVGSNVEKLKTGNGSYAHHLPIPYHSEVGIIFGYMGNRHGYNPLIKGDNDGLLSPQATSLGMEKDIAAVKVNHAMIHRNKKVGNMVVNFLRNGSFHIK